MRRQLTTITLFSVNCVVLFANLAVAGDNDVQTRQVQVPAQVQVPQHTPHQAVQVPHQNHSGGGHMRQVIIDNGGGSTLAYFSNRLGARFLIQSIQIGNFPSVMAARIVSDPVFGSPLQQAGLAMGDVITRLDGVPVTNTNELERHILDTKVRFVKAGSSTVSESWIWIDQHRYFQETQYGPCNDCHNGGGGLRP